MVCYSYQTHEVKMTTQESSNHSPLNFNIYVKINFFVFVFVRAFLYLLYTLCGREHKRGQECFCGNNGYG